MRPSVIGPYRIVRPLGDGSEGNVYEAWDYRVNRRVLLKALDEAGSLEQRARLERETCDVAALSHPSIAAVYDLLTEGGVDWLVMELVEGRRLDTLLAAGPLPPAQVARIGESVALALAALHDLGLVHGDVRAENVVVSDGDDVKVLGAGLAALLDGPNARLAPDGLVLGMHRPMSPEQATGQPLDARSDVFSLGAMLYGLASGRSPFGGKTNLDTLSRVARARHVPLADAAPDLPPAFGRVIERCLERDPECRFQTATELADALAAWVAIGVGARGTPGDAPRPTNAGRAALKLLFRPTVLAGVGAALAAALVVVWMSWRNAAGPLAVAALPVDAGEGASMLAAAAVADAVESYLASLGGVDAISGQEVRLVAAAGRRETEVAREVGADEVVRSTVRASADGEEARVTLARVHGATGRVLWSTAVRTSASDLLLIGDSVRTALADGFADDRLAPGWRPRDASGGAIGRYIQVRAALDAGPSPGLADETRLLEEAIEESPGFVEAAALLLDLGRHVFEARRDPAARARGEEALARALRLDASHPSVVDRAIRFRLALGRFDQAAEAARAALARRPGDASLWCHLGVALARLNDVAGSDGAFDRSRTLRDSWYSSVMWAEARIARRDFDGARTLLRATLAASPTNVVAAGALVYVEAETGRYAEAEPLARSLVARRGSAIDHFNLGAALFYQGRHEDAIVGFRTAAALAPADPTPVVGEADAHLWAGRRDAAHEDYERAVALCDQALASNPLDADILRLKALGLAHLGRSGEAMATVQQAVGLAPASPRPAFAAAVVSALAGEPESCLVWTRKARERGAPAIWFSGPEFDAQRGAGEFAALLSRQQPE